MNSKVNNFNKSAGVTIVIPTYNYAHFLKEAIESALDQTYNNTHVLVVDDGSTDHTQEVINNYPNITNHYKENGGLSAARNTGLELTESEYVLFLDADDRLLPNAVADCIAFFEEDIDFVVGSYRLIDKVGNNIEYEPIAPSSDDLYAELLKHTFIGVPGSVVYKSVSLRRIGAFDIELKSCEDLDVYLELARTGSIAYTPKVVVEYRKHSGSMSSNSIVMHQHFRKVLEKHLEINSNPDTNYTPYCKQGLAYWNEVLGRRIFANSLSSIRRLKFEYAYKNISYLYSDNDLSLSKSAVDLLMKNFRKLF